MTRTIKDPRQLVLDDLYQVPPARPATPGSLRIADAVCEAMSAALKASCLSRSEICTRMSDLTLDRITEPMLNAWTAASHGRHRFPLEYAAAFETAAETACLIELLASHRGSLVLHGREAQDAQLGWVRRQLTQLRAAERTLLREASR
ncbi:hypothetical protein [Caenispirillum bisanense]|uniref:Uncharacterized protein n=1 Tax=Caenispirillum bisanense TaxID=414052 RepID=A0A286GYI9_9PROT|nr:hypothetical protein [Caenispirillum bisanense]SOE00607.1 hypothetical protein SAMN05421508_11360 [Caenispirillum bisanense]